MSTLKTYVFCQLQVEGIHCWPDCPLPEVIYLKSPHRHIFHIRAEIQVSHDNRDVEFIQLKHKIHKYLHDNFWSDQYQCFNFRTFSCEQIATFLIVTFDLVKCEVNEDGENGAIIIKCED